MTVEVDYNELIAASRPPASMDEAQLRVYLSLYCDLGQRRWGAPIPKLPLDREHCRQLAVTAYRVSTLADDDIYRVALLDATADMPLERQHRLMKLMHDTGRTLSQYLQHIAAIDASFEQLRGPVPPGDEEDGSIDFEEQRKRRGRG